MPSEIVFGTDGWRGRIAREVTFEAVAAVVDAVNSWNVSETTPDPGDPWTVPVVFDTRFLSPEFARATAHQMAEKGFRVLLSAVPAPTPCASWHVRSRGLRSGIAITASHNPPEWNGLKVKAHFGGSAPSETYAAIASFAGKRLPARPGGKVEVTDLIGPYVDAIAAVVDIAAIREAGLSVLFDTMHGACGTLLETIVGKGHKTNVSTLRGERDPLFGGVHPEPIPEHLQVSADAARAGHFDLVLASDGDGDRLGVLDARGEFVTPHRILALLAESLAARGRIGGGIAKTFSTSLLLDRVAARLGVPLQTTPIGFKYIAEKMITGEVGIGGEESGGLGVSFFLPERDGILSALLVLEAIAHSGKSFGSLLAEQDSTYGSFAYGRRDIRLPMPILRAFVDRLASAPPNQRAGQKVTRVSTLDGLKLEFGDRGWLLHRLSGTEPILRIYAEHEDPGVVDRLLSETEGELERS
jgi:phosphomannomutase